MRVTRILLTLACAAAGGYVAWADRPTALILGAARPHWAIGSMGLGALAQFFFSLFLTGVDIWFISPVGDFITASKLDTASAPRRDVECGFTGMDYPAIAVLSLSVLLGGGCGLIGGWFHSISPPMAGVAAAALTCSLVGFAVASLPVRWLMNLAGIGLAGLATTCLGGVLALIICAANLYVVEFGRPLLWAILWGTLALAPLPGTVIAAWAGPAERGKQPLWLLLGFLFGLAHAAITASIGFS